MTIAFSWFPHWSFHWIICTAYTICMFLRMGLCIRYWPTCQEARRYLAASSITATVTIEWNGLGKTSCGCYALYEYIHALPVNSRICRKHQQYRHIASWRLKSPAILQGFFQQFVRANNNNKNINTFLVLQPGNPSVYYNPQRVIRAASGWLLSLLHDIVWSFQQQWQSNNVGCPTSHTCFTVISVSLFY